MSGSSKIEWTHATWNPLTGCTLVSEGCRNCYAAREAAGRLSHHPAYEGLAVKRGGRAVFTGEIRLHPDRLDQPLRWRKPRRVFVNSMSDLFHPDVPDEFIARVFAIMELAKRHTFQVLTKRPERMAALLHDPGFIEQVRERLLVEDSHQFVTVFNGWWPISNVWLGTSVEDQATANERISHLLETPAAVRFLSCEPLLGPVDLARIGHFRDESLSALEEIVGWVQRPAVDWVIVGGESGPNARRMETEWAASLVRQCREARVPVFVKQLGDAHGRGHKSIGSFPTELQVREYPVAGGQS